MKLLRNQKGVALLIALSTLVILTTAVVEFSFTRRVNYQLAVNDKQRLQAYYLAKSAYRLGLLILTFHKEAEKLKKQVAGAAGADIGPLYKMVPLSTELLRGMFLEGGGEASPASDDEDKDASVEELQAGTSFLDKEEAQKFLSFEGDFDAQISEEQTKFDLNKFYGVETTSKTYDQRKKLLYSILLLPQFEDVFEKIKLDPEEVAHAIGDWVDINGVINEFDGVQRGNEDSKYAEVDYRTKNGKILSMSELRLIYGIVDDVYAKLKNLVTVYSGSEKINLCLAEDDTLTKALIYHFMKHAECAREIDYEDTDRMEELVTVVKGGCPDSASMASALYSQLGLSASGSGCQFAFKDLVTSDNKVFSIKGAARVGDTQLSLSSIVDTSSTDPRKWKRHYFRIE